MREKIGQQSYYIFSRIDFSYSGDMYLTRETLLKWPGSHISCFFFMCLLEVLYVHIKIKYTIRISLPPYFISKPAKNNSQITEILILRTE